MKTRFKKKAKIFNIGLTAVVAAVSVGIMLYGIMYFGLRETWPELVLNTCYITCLVLMYKYFFNKIDAQYFNYWSSVYIGITVLLRDILFPPPIPYFALQKICLALSVLLIMMLTFFYARKRWKAYSKHSLWMIFVIDSIIASLYNIYLFIEPINEYTIYLITEIWIRPTITYGIVACYITETKQNK